MDNSKQGPRSTVGLFHRPDHQDVIVGRQVAVDAFVNALARHGWNHRYALFCHAREMKRAGIGLDLETGCVSLRDRRELLRLDDFDLTAWHETQFDTYTPFALRARARVPFPVSLVHHTLSYKELLHDSILRLLLAEAHAYDSVICTSLAALRTVKELVAQVSERFEAEYKVVLSYPGRYDLIPLGVDTTTYRPQDRREARSRFRIDSDAFVLLWTGRLSIVDKADLLPLVQAFAKLSKCNPACNLQLVCAGSQRPGERFGAVLRDYARHLGVAGQVRIMTEGAEFAPWKEKLYAAANVFVSPVDNIQESFGLTPVEAMACGVPQVVSDWSGYRETVVHGETGFLMPTCWAPCQDELSRTGLWTETSYDHLALAESVVVDLEALVTFVQRLIDEPALAEAMACASRRRAEQEYSWSTVIGRYESLWSELSAEARRRPGPHRSEAAYAAPDYRRCFEHFASRQLGSEAELSLTALGEDLVRGSASIPTHYNEEWQYLDMTVIKRIVAGLVRTGERGEPLTLGRILAVMSRDTADPLARAFILRHVLFLMKYGFIADVSR